MKRIDSHQHFWFYDPIRERWITDEMANIRRDFLPEEFRPLLVESRMEGSVLVQASDSEEETLLLLEFAKEHSFIKGVVGWVDLCAENAGERLAYFAAHPVFRGIRHSLQSVAPEFMLRADFQQGISCLRDYDLSFDLLILEHQLSAAIELVRNFPHQPFVLDHMAKPRISGKVSSQWAKGIKGLAMAGNVFCKVSGFLVETPAFRWKPEDFYPFFEVILKAFGPDRIMYGSDWPVCLAAGTYQDTIEIPEKFFEHRAAGILPKLMGENASRFYRL